MEADFAANLDNALTIATHEDGAHHFNIIVFSHLRWNFVWQRPQQILSRLAHRHSILFVEEPIYDMQDAASCYMDLREAAPNLTTLVPHVSPDLPPDIVNELKRKFVLRAAERFTTNGGARLLLWYYSPSEAVWSLDMLPHGGVVYDCMDELSLFAGASASIVDDEQVLLRHADIVFTGGKNLYEQKRRLHDNVHFFGCGVEYRHFADAQDREGPVPIDIAGIRPPIMGWFGVIDERMDFNLVEKIADLRPRWSFVFIGPVVKVNPSCLPRRPNLHWLGPRDYADLPAYCRAFDVCMMPFALNEATRYINPTKALEYLSTGRPVVSTPVQDVVDQYEDCIHIARTPEEFVDAVERGLSGLGNQFVERGMERAKIASWESTVSQMQDLIRLCLK